MVRVREVAVRADCTAEDDGLDEEFQEAGAWEVGVLVGGVVGFEVEEGDEGEDGKVVVGVAVVCCVFYTDGSVVGVVEVAEECVVWVGGVLQDVVHVSEDVEAVEKAMAVVVDEGEAPVVGEECVLSCSMPSV